MLKLFNFFFFICNIKDLSDFENERLNSPELPCFQDLQPKSLSILLYVTICNNSPYHAIQQENDPSILEIQLFLKVLLKALKWLY